MKINIKPMMASSHGAKLVLLLMYWYVIAAVLTGFLGLPKSIVYIGDILNIWLFLKAIYRFKQRGMRLKHNGVMTSIMFFSIIVLIGGLVNINSPVLLLWGIRQNFRYFIYYFSCIVFLQKQDIKKIFGLTGILFWISLPLCIYEALIVKYPVGTIIGDYVGGIYYGIDGVNAPLNIVMIIYCTKNLIEYFKKRTSIRFIAFVLVAAIGMAALSELKIFLVELVIIALIVMIRSGKPLKSILVIIGGVIILGIAVQVFVQLNGRGRSYYSADYFSVSGMIENALRSTGYDGNGDLNRFFAVQTLSDMFFRNDVLGKLLGLGLGNAEYSKSFGMLTSEFYENYNWLHYQYFSISFVFIETGILGLISYFMIFISGIMQGFRRIAKESFYGIFFFTMGVMMLILIFYNPSLRNEQCGFMLYFILAIPMILSKEKSGGELL